MAKLKNLNELGETDLIDLLSNNEILVCEDIQGSKIYANYNGSEWVIKPKSISAEQINNVDLAIQKYYNRAINYLNSIDDRAKKLLNKSWWFGFEYFPDEQPANIEYARVPKNNLVLTTIYKKNKYDYTVEELVEYARLLDVEEMPVIFKGKLSETTLEGIKYFLHTSEKDLEYVFGEKSFAFFFYKLLNPLSSGSFLMNNEFQENIQRLILRIDGQNISFEILNPFYSKISNTNNTEFAEIYSMILLNFMAYCQTFNLKDIKLIGNRKDDVYLSLMCRMFNRYIDEVKNDLLKFEFTIPEFFDKDKFRINKELLKNKETISKIEEDPKLEYIFKCIIGSFNKRKKNVIGVFTSETIKVFNTYVHDISAYIDAYLGKKSEIEISRKGLMNFSDFFNIRYDVDGAGEVYPDVYKAFANADGSNKDKKKGGLDGKIKK